MHRRSDLAFAFPMLLTVAAGCDSPKSEPAKPASAAVEKAASGRDGQASPASPEDAERAKLVQAAAQIHEHLELAHAKADAGDWKAAVAAYEQAARLDDDNPRILGELGWAQFNAGSLEGAQKNLRLALRYAKDAPRRADLLYKLGRVAEQREDYVQAKEYYDQSLAIEDDAEARAHEGAVAPKSVAICTESGCEEPHYADLDAACAGMLARVYELKGIEPQAGDDDFTCDAKQARTIALLGGEATEAAILVVRGVHLGTKEEEHDLFAKIGGDWHRVGTLLDLHNPDHGGVTRKGALAGLEAKEVLPDSNGPEVLIQVEFEESNADLDANIVYTQVQHGTIVCGVAEGTDTCHEIPTRVSYRAEALDSKAPTRGDLEAQEFTATVAFDGKGSVSVTGKGKGTGKGGIPAGTYAIRELPAPQGFAFVHVD